MRPKAAEIRALGAELVFIGNGSPQQAKAFRKEHALDLPLYTDPSKRAHRCADFARGKRTSLSPKAILNGLKARVRGFKQEFIAGDPLQQGGVFVVAPGDETLFAYRSEVAGDHPDPETVVLALRAREQRTDVRRVRGSEPRAGG